LIAEDEYEMAKGRFGHAVIIPQRIASEQGGDR